MNQKGFTLIELIVTVAIFAILSLGVIALVSGVLVDSSRQGRSLANADQTRKLAAQMMSELRNAVAGSNGAYPLAIADDQQLEFYSNVDGGTDIERVRYYVQNGQLRKGIVKQSGSPPTYNGTETSTVVQNDLANGSSPLFYYYDNTLATTTDRALTQPVNISQVSYISLQVVVLKRISNTGTDTFTVTAGAALRSLKTNLGD